VPIVGITNEKGNFSLFEKQGGKCSEDLEDLLRVAPCLQLYFFLQQPGHDLGAFPATEGTVD
jgi:hypothetical protein